MAAADQWHADPQCLSACPCHAVRCGECLHLSIDAMQEYIAKSEFT